MHTNVHTDETAVLRFRGSNGDDCEIELPIVIGSESEMALDISNLRAQTGAITLDRALGNTGAVLSDITYLSGEEGILHHRGYDVADLATHCSFEEVAYLLLTGELPTSTELGDYCDTLRRRMYLPPTVKMLLRSFPRFAHPMEMLQAALPALACHFPECISPNDKAKRLDLATHLLAQMPLLIGYIHRHRTNDLPQLNERPYQGRYVENFLEAMFGNKGEDYSPDPIAVAALNTMLIAHIDHEQNCSTTAARVVGSSQANGFAVISAAIGALSGPLHGGANEEVIRMLNHIIDSGESVEQVIAAVKARELLLMGFGHRVYKNFDPRAEICKARCDEVLAALHLDDPKLPIAKALEDAALNDDFFISRKLFPNVDFYSGIVYGALGFPLEMFTPLFVLGRTPGWLAHWIEELSQPHPRINRPRQIYTGLTARRLVALEERELAAKP